MYLIIPELREVVLHATFVSPVAHNDAAMSDSSNTMLFRRQKHVVNREHTVVPDAAIVERVVASQPVPESLAALLETLSVAEFLSVALAARFVLLYNSKDGAGLFAGVERYSMLEPRLKHNAVRARSAYDFWGGLVADMNAGLTRTHDDALNALLTMPLALAALALTELAHNSAAAVMLARSWYEARGEKTVAIQLDPVDFAASAQVTVRLPAVSANSLRHEMVREPGAWHLLNALGLRFEDLHPGAAALLYNGGDMHRSPESGAFGLQRQAVSAYPLLALEGGSASGFLMKSNLTCHAWLRCKENNDALARYDMASDVSAFDLLDRVEHTRHNGGVVDTSPMIYGMETLAKGAEVVVRFALTPYADSLQAGALWAALDSYRHGDSTLFGAAAKGYGLLQTNILRLPDYDMDALRGDYEGYLTQHAEALRGGLLDGTLTTGEKVLS